jgi:hypothetical protein
MNGVFLLSTVVGAATTALVWFAWPRVRLWWLARKVMKRSTVDTATGADLDILAWHIFGIRRRVETDSELRARIVEETRVFDR